MWEAIILFSLSFLQASMSQQPTSRGSPVFSSVSCSMLANVSRGSTSEYMYSSTIVQFGERRYSFYCCDKKTEQPIRDHIGLRIGRQFSDRQDENKWIYGDEIIVLSPLDHGVRHFCDPAVVEGIFTLWVSLGQQETFRYLMAFTYTVNDLGKGWNNKVGMALSNDLLNWRVRPGPLVDCHEKDVWGVGQPSITRVDESTILLFYTRGDSRGSAMFRQKIGLRNASQPVYGGEIRLPVKGLYGSDFLPMNSVFNGAVSFFVDSRVSPQTRLFFLVHEGTPMPKTDPKYIANFVQLAFIEESEIWTPSESSRWKVVDNVRVSGYNRTHNARWTVSSVGQRVCNDVLEYTVSISRSGTFEESLWSYRIFTVAANFRPGFDYVSYKPLPIPVRELSCNLNEDE